MVSRTAFSMTGDPGHMSAGVAVVFGEMLSRPQLSDKIDSHFVLQQLKEQGLSLWAFNKVYV